MILSKLFYENLPKNKNGDIINIIDQRVLNLTPHFLVIQSQNLLCGHLLEPLH